MLQSIAGTYTNGVVRLTELPPNIQTSKVIVTFLDAGDENPIDRFITLGMFAGQNQSTAEDFEIAEFRGDLDDSLNWT